MCQAETTPKARRPDRHPVWGIPTSHTATGPGFGSGAALEHGTWPAPHLMTWGTGGNAGLQTKS